MPGNEIATVSLSLCIPTNGIKNWVEPVLESIFRQNVSEDKYEVVITDNGKNDDFYNAMQIWCNKHGNIHYRRTTALGFLNQIESFRDAKGEFIKFVNHRMMLKDGALEYMLSFVNDRRKSRPICYFSNGVLSFLPKSKFETFDGFVRVLSYYSSWSAGLGIWRSDFLRLPENFSYNTLFPHTTILLRSYKNRLYEIDNHVLMESLPENYPKGKYNLFFAFAVEYPSIIVDLLRRGEISLETALSIKKELLYFLSGLYLDFKILKKPCSYDLAHIDESINLYYNKKMLIFGVCRNFLHRILRKVH